MQTFRLKEEHHGESACEKEAAQTREGCWLCETATVGKLNGGKRKRVIRYIARCRGFGAQESIGAYTWGRK